MPKPYTDKAADAATDDLSVWDFFWKKPFSKSQTERHLSSLRDLLMYVWLMTSD